VEVVKTIHENVNRMIEPTQVKNFNSHGEYYEKDQSSYAANGYFIQQLFECSYEISIILCFLRLNEMALKKTKKIAKFMKKV